MKQSQKLYLPFKRFFDIVLAVFGIVVCLSLVWWWVFIINCFATKGHPIFVQKRYGKNRKIFKMYKFRSMKIDANPFISAPKMSKNKHANMDTWFGPFLRVSSIDETLQFFNVLIGNMAFVGPRPDMIKNDERLIECRNKCNPSPYIVKPGITGYAQIMMKRGHSPALKAKYDSIYVKKLSFWLDAKIFITTSIKIFGLYRGR